MSDLTAAERREQRRKARAFHKADALRTSRETSGAGRGMKARFASHCARCGRMIEPGTEITSVLGDWVHATCPVEIVDGTPDRHGYLTSAQRCALDADRHAHPRHAPGWQIWDE